MWIFRLYVFCKYNCKEKKKYKKGCLQGKEEEVVPMEVMAPKILILPKSMETSDPMTSVLQTQPVYFHSIQPPPSVSALNLREVLHLQHPPWLFSGNKTTIICSCSWAAQKIIPPHGPNPLISTHLNFSISVRTKHSSLTKEYQYLIDPLSRSSSRRSEAYKTLGVSNCTAAFLPQDKTPREAS